MPEPNVPQLEPLTGRTLRGTAVQMVATLALSALGLVQGVLFARWFVPAAVGVLETANLVVRFALLFSQLGTRQAVIRERQRFRPVLRSALVFDGLISSVSFLILVVAAPWIAQLFHNPELTLWIRVLAVTAYGTTLALPSAAWDQAMRFGISKVPRALGTLATIAATGAFHFLAGLGTESLLWGAIAGFVVENGALWALVPYRPRPAWDRADVRRLAAFSLPLLANALLTYIVFESDDLMVRFFGDDASLAIYRKAFEWPFYLTTLVAMTSAVLYPAMIRIEGKSDRLGRAFARSNRYIALFTLPAGVALAVFAAPLVSLLYGSRWEDCVPLLRWFALAFALRVATGYNWHLMPMSRGNTRSIARVGAGSAALTLALGLPLISRFGGMGGAVTNVLVLLLWALPARFWVIRQELGSLAFLRDLPRPLLAAAVAGVALAFVPPPAQTWLALALQMAAFAALYGMTILLLDRGLLGEMKALVVSMRRGP